MEEDYVGQMVKMLKGAVHTKTLGLRSLQRWLLQYNCEMAPRENMSAAVSQRNLSTLQTMESYVVQTSTLIFVDTQDSLGLHAKSLSYGSGIPC